MNRRTQVLIGLAVGIVCGVAIVVALMAFGVASEQRQAGAITRSQVAAIARRVLALERPSDRELRKRIEIALRRCLHSQKCLGVLGDAVRHSQPTAVIRRRLLQAAPPAGPRKRTSPRVVHRRPPTRRPGPTPTPTPLPRPSPLLPPLPRLPCLPVVGCP